jgi:hypothetical protein
MQQETAKTKEIKQNGAQVFHLRPARQKVDYLSQLPQSRLSLLVMVQVTVSEHDTTL